MLALGLRYFTNDVNTPNVENRSLFLMQNNVEIGLKHENLMLIGTLGTVEGPSGFHALNSLENSVARGLLLQNTHPQ